MREIVLDTETTGLDPTSGHRIIEIGCIELHGRARTGKFFHTYLNPERDVPKDAERVHGIATEFLLDKPLFSHVSQEFLAFIEDADLVIHNAGFDMKFLNHELKSLGLPLIPFDRIVDTLELARRKYPGQPASLDALCKRFEIDLSRRAKHGALLDAELLSEVYVELTGGKQTALDLSQLAAEEKAAAATLSAAAIPYRQFEATEEERAAHATFLKQLKEPMWEKLESL